MATHDLLPTDEGTTLHDFPDTTGSVVILGAGIAGLALAAGLHKVGIPCIVLERAPELRQAGNAIGMWPNSFRALDALGCGDKAFRESFAQNTGVQIWTQTGKKLRYLELEEHMGEGRACENRPVGRAALLQKLAGGFPKDSLYFSATAVSVADTDVGALVTLKNGQTLEAKVVVGAEGGSSPTARYLGLPDPKYEGYIGIRGLAPLKTALDAGATTPATFTMVMGQGNRMGIIPMDKDNVYWFFTHAAPEDLHIYDPEKVREEALGAAKGWAFPAKAVLQAAPRESLQRSRIFDRLMPAGKPFGKGSVTVVGDAAHVSTPNLGQGGCAALEDAVEFTRILRLGVGGEVGTSGPAFQAASKQSIASALREYERHRTKRTTEIVKKSWAAGYVGQLTWTPLAMMRNFYTANLLSGKSFFDHTLYDCGTL